MTKEAESTLECSVVVPVFNETQSIEELYKELSDVFYTRGPYELIFVNDGSVDETFDILKQLAERDPKVKIIDFHSNHGQTAALMAGINHARGRVLVTIDSDLENDPADIPRLLEKFEEGYDIVSGWRRGRWKGQLFTRALPSYVANWLIAAITRLPLHDSGCTLKVYRRDLFRNIHLYGEMHRFVPASLFRKGMRVAEVVIAHRPRKYGKSHYGFSRTFRVLLDLILVRFLAKYFDRPMHFFGGVGFISLGLGTLAGLAAVALRIFWDLHLVQTPLPVFSALLIIVGIQLIGMGVLAEILIRIYYEGQHKQPYSIRETINL